MSMQSHIHGDSFDAAVETYFDSDDPFVTFRVTSTENIKNHWNKKEDGSYGTINRSGGAAVFFIRTSEDAIRIFEAARKLVAAMQDLEFEKQLKEVLKADIESFFEDGGESTGC